MRPAIGLTVGVVSALFVVDMLGVYAAYLRDKREQQEDEAARQWADEVYKAKLECMTAAWP